MTTASPPTQLIQINCKIKKEKTYKSETYLHRGVVPLLHAYGIGLHDIKVFQLSLREL